MISWDGEINCRFRRRKESRWRSWAGCQGGHKWLQMYPERWQMITNDQRGPAWTRSVTCACGKWVNGRRSKPVSQSSVHNLGKYKNNKSWQIQKQQISTMFRCPLKYTLLIKNEQIAVRRSVFGLKKKKKKNPKFKGWQWDLKNPKFKGEKD